ncbi:hypothetical protein D3Z62_19605, partial [Lachnospiraceae bacterium]|nr:hypothetical protein [Lachnospiraceae bacterium]
MKEERIDLYSSIVSAILGLVGVTSYGTVATVTSVTSYLPGIVASKIKEFNGQMEFNKKVEKEFILALVAAADSTEKHLNQKNAKNLFLLMASEIRNVCQKSDNLEKILYDLNETLSKLQIDLEKQRMYEEWITSNNIKEIMKLYFGELNKIISNDYPELGIYLLLIENSESIKKNRQQDIILIDHENRIEEIEKKKMHDIFEIEESVNIILNIIKRYYFKDIKKGSSSLYFLEINNNLFPELTDNIGIKYVDMNSNEIPIFQYVTENWINGNEYINLLLTAEGGMGKTVSLFKCCELLLNQNIMSIYIPLYHMKSIGTDNIEKFIFKYIFRNDKRTFDFFEKYINQSSIDIKLILLLDG